MFACMTGTPPQPVDQRKLDDKMEEHFRKLEGVYSSRLIQVVRWSLTVDPLQRPQSVFSLQRALMTPDPKEEVSFMVKVSRKLRNLFYSRIQFRRALPVAVDTIQENTR